MHRYNTILLVDDDSINNFLNERLIKKLNIARKVKVTLNGAEGIEYLKQHCKNDNPDCPEVIFLDINMPVMDGFEFIKAFDNIQFKERTRIIILTTSRNPKDIDVLKALGNFDFINKPLTEEKIYQCLTKVEH